MGNFRIPEPYNEPIYAYAPGSPEREALKKAIAELKSKQVDIPMVIGGQEVRTSRREAITAPHNHALKLGEYYKGGPEEVAAAVKAALDARERWAMVPWQHRAAIFLKAAELLAGPYRYIINAATMLAHSKNVFQAEIDSACELIDFFRFNCYYAQQIYDMQPANAHAVWDRIEFRPLEGFVFAVTPFNFVSIGGNLPTSPAIMGNTVVWKPASTGVYTAHIIMNILKEAGLPCGVINLVTAPGSAIGDLVLKNPNLAGVHFTGSTAVFHNMWKTIGENIKNYKNYPRIVGETGGKDFVFVHASAEPRETAVALIRGAFEYQGQKCSAASRAYIPKSLWTEIKNQMLTMHKEMKMGDVEDFTNFINAVIDKGAYNSIVEYIDYARNSGEAEFVFGGKYDDSKGYFIEPTLILTHNPHFRLLEEEIFGPVLTVYVYEDADYEKTLRLCDETSPYALTGSIFARARAAIIIAEKMLTHAAGNFYINDKPTGAVVGQQPFGGGRASGTNDKAGSLLNLIRWCSPRTIKENFVPPRDFKYPFMSQS